MSSQAQQLFYASLAAVGVIATWTFNLQFIAETGGFSVVEFVRACYANAAAASITNDLLVVVALFLFWSWRESRRLGMRHWWIYVPLTFGIAIAFAFPLFMLMRDRAMAAQRLSGA
jgi:hypothetical protein